MSDQTPEQIAARYRELFGNMDPASDDNGNNIPDGMETVFEESEESILEAQRILDQTDPSFYPQFLPYYR